jgi:radical SAM superfamily enzyme YgiQ (UPF0313 family)
MDCLFLHVSKNDRNNQDAIKIPLGLTALAWFLTKKKISSEILNLSVEYIVDKNFRIDKYIKVKKIKILCMDLHWHSQAYNVIETAKLVKESNPDCQIVLGGFTSTLFAREIMDSHREIDFIIKGDAEVPLSQLIAMLIDKRKDGLAEKRQNY